LHGGFSFFFILKDDRGNFNDFRSSEKNLRFFSIGFSDRGYIIRILRTWNLLKMKMEGLK